MHVILETMVKFVFSSSYFWTSIRFPILMTTIAAAKIVTITGLAVADDSNNNAFEQGKMWVLLLNLK